MVINNHTYSLVTENLLVLLMFQIIIMYISVYFIYI